MTNNIEARLAVCSWSLQPETPEALIAQLREIGLSREHILKMGGLKPRQNLHVLVKYAFLEKKHILKKRG